MTKLLPTLVPVLAALAAATAPTIQHWLAGFMAMHPALTAASMAIWAAYAHAMPSSMGVSDEKN